MKTVNQMVIFDKLGSLLNTREAAINLMEIIAKAESKTVELDFSNVEFMSRSFADQFYKERNSFQEKTNSIININNANEEIIKILQVVSKTQDKKEREYISIPVYKFSDKNLLKNYLLSSI